MYSKTILTFAPLARVCNALTDPVQMKWRMTLWMSICIGCCVAQSRIRTNSERIDGPANIRDGNTGKVLFSLNDDVPVNTTDTSKGRYYVGLFVDITPTQWHAQKIGKGSILYANGKVVGRALADLSLDMSSDGAKAAVISGYTALQNIKAETEPEYILSRILSAHDTVSYDTLLYFVRDFGLDVSTIGRYPGYRLDLTQIDDLSAPLRMFLFVRNKQIVAIVTDRAIGYKGSHVYPLDRKYHLTVVGNQKSLIINNFKREFNYFIDHAD
jgi:hypothetical protein